MSVESTTLAFHHSRAKGTAKVVLLGIANHDGDGGAWPSVRTLAKYANVDERNVQRALTELERLGEIQRFVMAGGTGATAKHRRPNLYRVTIVCPPTCDRSARHNVTAEDAVAAAAEEAFYPLAQTSPLHPVAQTSPPGASATPTPGAAVTRTIPRTTHSSLVGNSSDPARTNEGLQTCSAQWRAGRPCVFESSGYCAHCGARAEAVAS